MLLDREVDRHLVLRADALQLLGRRRIGDEMVDLGNVADAHRRGAAVLQAVGDQDGAAAALHDLARHLHFAVVVVEQAAVLVYRGGADDRVVHLELAQEFHRRLADDAAIGMSQHAARDDHFDIRVALQDVDHVHVVGDHHQALVRAQGGGHLLGGGADVDQQRAVVRDQFGRLQADAPLGVGGELPPRFVGEVGDARRQHRAAVVALQHALVAELVQVLADRLRRDAKRLASAVDVEPAAVAGERDDVRLSWGK